MKIGLVFPGYGSQFVTMAKELYDESRLIQEYFEEASNCLNTNFVKLCFASSEIELAKTQNAYPALFLVSSSIAALLQEHQISIDLVGGYGMGEYAALHAAGSLSLPDGLYLLSKLALLLNEELSQNTFTSLRIKGVSDRIVVRLCREILTEFHQIYRSVLLSSQESIVVGTVDAIGELKVLLSEFAKAAQIKSHPVEFGLYSLLAKKLIITLSMYLEKVDFKDCTINWSRPSDGHLIKNGRLIRNSIIKHLVQPIRADKMMKSFSKMDIIIVPAPGIKFSQWVQTIYPDKQVISLANPTDLEKIIKINESFKQAEQDNLEKLALESVANPVENSSISF